MTQLTCGRRKDSIEGDRKVARRHSSLFLAVCVAILSLSAAALGQELAATLTGAVTDSSGVDFSVATILIHNNDTGAHLPSATTSSDGFNIPLLSAGHYTVMFKAAGFQTCVAKDVVLNVA